MKEKIFMFIIGLLVGAILATGGFYIYQKNNKTSESTNTTSQNQTQNFEERGQRGGGKMPGNFDGEEPPEMPDGEMPEMQEGEEPPAKPDDEESNSTSEKRTKPNKNNNTTKTEKSTTEG